MRKLRRKGPYKDSDGRMHIPPSRVGQCLRWFQFKQQNAQEERPSYYMYRGRLVHDVAEELIKSANPESAKAWKKIRTRQGYIPWEWRLPLNRVMPRFENTFRDFLLHNKFGIALQTSPVWIEEKISIPLEDLNNLLRFKLPFKDEELKLFQVVGKPDCYYSPLIVEFKTGKIRKSAFLQGLLYEKMAKLYFHNPKAKNRIIKIGTKEVKLLMGSKFWALPEGEYRIRKEKELSAALSEMITHLLKWNEDPNHKMPRKISSHCPKCVYYPVCMSPIRWKLWKLTHTLRKKYRKMKKFISSILKSSNKKKKKRKNPKLSVPK